MEYQFHEYADLFPLLVDKAYEALKSDIAKNGLTNPIVLFEGKILDGRNRYRACKELEMQLVTTDYDGVHPLEFVLSANVHRRHLKTSQLALIATIAVNTYQGERRDLELPVNLPKVSQEDAALMFGISEKLVRNAKIILEKGSEDQIESVRSGKKTISAILNEILPKNKQEQKALRTPKDNEANTTNDIQPKFETDPGIRDCLGIELINVEAVKQLSPSVQAKKVVAALKILYESWNDRGRREFTDSLRELLSTTIKQ